MKRYLALGFIAIVGALLVVAGVELYQVFTPALAGGGQPGSADPVFHEGDQPLHPLKSLPDADALAERLPDGQATYKKLRDDVLGTYAKRHPGTHDNDDEARQSLKLMAYLWTWGDFYGENLLPNLADHARHLNHGESADPVWDVANDLDWYDVYYSSCDDDAGRNMKRADALNATDYPAALRLWAYQRALANLVIAEGHDDARAAMGASLGRLPELAAKAAACYENLLAQHLPNKMLYTKGRELLAAATQDPAALEASPRAWTARSPPRIATIRRHNSSMRFSTSTRAWPREAMVMRTPSATRAGRASAKTCSTLARC